MTNVVVPERTLKRSAAIFSEIMDIGDNVIEFEKITVRRVDPNAKKGSIFGETDLKFLQDIIVSREKAKNGAGVAEIIALIGEIAQCFDLIKCRNHWNYIVMLGKLKELKGGGRLRKAQNTTTKRTQITIEQQLLCNATLDSAIDELCTKFTHTPVKECIPCAILECIMGLHDLPAMINRQGCLMVILVAI